MPVRKVHRIQAADGRVFLVGCCGRADHIEAFFAWMRGGEKPSMPLDAEFSALVIDERRRAWNIHDTLIYVRCTAKRWAIGSGCDYALGAMEAGASAEQAVRIASRLDVHCGFGVNSVRF